MSHLWQSKISHIPRVWPVQPLTHLVDLPATPQAQPVPSAKAPQPFLHDKPFELLQLCGLRLRQLGSA